MNFNGKYNNSSDVGRGASNVNAYSTLHARRPTLDESGFSLIEVLIALIIMVVCLVPLMDSITASFQSSSSAEENTVLLNRAREKMEEILAMNYADVAVSAPQGTPTALSDLVTVIGKTVNRDVFVEHYDGDGDAIADTDLKKITVIVDTVQLDSLKDNF